jgi:hypothetical protein
MKAKPKETTMIARFVGNALAALPVLLTAGVAGLSLGVVAAGPARANSSQSEQMVSIDPLTKYTLPDETASVMLPQGWRVTYTGIAFIRAEGPKGELGFFGLVVPAHDSTAGSGPTSGAHLNQPYSADTGDKIQQSINWVRAANGQSPVQVNVISKQAFTAPPEFGQCSRVLMTLGVQNLGTLNSEADFCSLPTDASGNYRNFMKIVAAPPDIAAAQRSTLEAVLASYMLNMKAVQARLAQRDGAGAQSSQDAAQPNGAQGSSAGSSGQSSGASQSPGSSQSSGSSGGGPQQPQSNQKSAQSPQAHSAQNLPAMRNASAQSRGGGSTYQSLQQKINAEIAQGGFSPQMVAAMRAQATAQANAVMAPMMNQMRSFDQSVNYFDRSVIRGQIPVSITHAGTFWLDPN